MRYLERSNVETAARFLAKKTGDEWTPELILDRLWQLLTTHSDGLGLDTVRVLLPSGWQLQDTLTNEEISLDRPTEVEVTQAEDLIKQFRLFDDAKTAKGQAAALVLGNRRFRSAGLIPVSLLRLVPSDLAALANLPERESITPFHDLVADIHAGRLPELAAELDTVACKENLKKPRAAEAVDDDTQVSPSAAAATPRAEVPLPAEACADRDLADLFDPVRKETLQAMFPDKQWSKYAERADRNGLKEARVGRGMFNPYLAAQWWLKKRHPLTGHGRDA